MKKAAMALLPVLLLGGCAQPPVWQVVGVYTSPELPDEQPGRADFVFNEGHLTGSTECAPVEGSFELSNAGDVQTMRITDIDFGDPGDCIGGPRHTHDKLESVLVAGAEFEVIDVSETEKLLRSTAALDAPSVRLMML